MVKFASIFYHKTFELKVEFNENQTEIDILKNECEFGFGGDSNDAKMLFLRSTRSCDRDG